MITIKNEREIQAMRAAGRITAGARALAGQLVKPGVSTKAIDRAVHDFIVSSYGAMTARKKSIFGATGKAALMLR